MKVPSALLRPRVAALTVPVTIAAETLPCRCLPATSTHLHQRMPGMQLLIQRCEEGSCLRSLSGFLCFPVAAHHRLAAADQEGLNGSVGKARTAGHNTSGERPRKQLKLQQTQRAQLLIQAASCLR